MTELCYKYKQQQQQQQQHRMDPNREVEVWVGDANGLRYGVRMPISSTFNDVRRKLLQENGNFQGIIVGFEGGRNERTIVSQTLLKMKNVSNVMFYVQMVVFRILFFMKN